MVNIFKAFRERKIKKEVDKQLAKMSVPKMKETFVARSKVTAALKYMDYNPDDLIEAKGKGLDLYQDMLRDPAVKSAIYHKSLSITNNGYSINPADENIPKNVEIAQALQWNLQEGLVGTFTQGIQDILKALVDGYSITEKNFYIIDRGEYKGLIGYKSFKGKNPDDVYLTLDQFNNIVNIKNLTEGADQEFVDTSKFIIYSYMPQYTNPYGRSDLRAAYRAFWLKDVFMKLSAVYGERYAMGFILANVPQNMSEDDREKVFAILKRVQAETAMVMPEEVKIEHKDSASGANNVYESMIALCNKEIVIGILGATLPMLEGEKTGAREGTREQGDTVSLFIRYLTLEIEEVIQEQIVRPWVDMNYADVTNYPVFKLQSGKEKDLIKTAALLEGAQKIGIDIPKAWAYEELKIPMPKEEDDILKKSVMPNPFMNGNPFEKKDEDKEKDDKKENPFIKEDKQEPEKIGEDKREDKRSDKKEEIEKHAENIKQHIAKENIREQERIVDQGLKESKGAFDDITKDILKQIKKKSLKNAQGLSSTSDLYGKYLSST